MFWPMKNFLEYFVLNAKETISVWVNTALVSKLFEHTLILWYLLHVGYTLRSKSSFAMSQQQVISTIIL